MRFYTFGATFVSMLAYMASQFCDVYVFHYFKKRTDGKKLWLRNNVSALTSQLVDSVAVILRTSVGWNTIIIFHPKFVFVQSSDRAARYHPILLRYKILKKLPASY
jgi:uncharacterized integral membrane protein (TIGR00697 family)